MLLGVTFSAHLMNRISSATESPDHYSSLELDSHADSPVVGKDAFILRYTGKKVRVSGFSDQLGSPLLVHVVDAALIYECEVSGDKYLIVIRNALYIKGMTCSLISPFILRLAGVTVNECPKFLANTPTREHHSLYFSEQDLRIPLQLQGIISYLPTRLPTQHEIDDPTLPILQFTPLFDEWDPHTSTYSAQEEAMTNFRGEVKEPVTKKFIISSLIQRSLDPDVFCYDITSRASELGCSSHTIYSIKTANGSISTLTPGMLADVWGIGLETARNTIKVTTRLSPRNTTDITLNRRYAQNDRNLRYKHMDSVLFMDTMFASKRVGKSYRDFTCVQVYASEFGWIRADPMKGEKDIHASLKHLFKDIGVPKKLIVDGARAQVKGKARENCDLASCKVIELEKDTPASNRAERYIRILKETSKRDMNQSDSPIIFWCYCIERRALIENATAKNNFLLNGSCPHSMMTGEMTDISNLCNFKWYEWVKFRKPGEQYPYPTEHLGRCLGPALNKGNAMSQHVLTETGEVLPVQTLRSLTQSEVISETETQKRKRMDETIRTRFGDSKTVPENWIKRRRKHNDPEQFEDPEHQQQQENPTTSYYEDEESGEAHQMPEIDDIPDLDLYLNAEVLLPQDGKHMQSAQVLGRVTDSNGNPVGEYNANPILNTRVYDVMFPDGSIQQYAANIIAENLYSQVDDDGRRYMILDEIVDHRKTDEAVPVEDSFIENKYGKRTRRLTTKGWSFLVNWKDGRQSWIPLKDIKESNPIEIAEYVTSRSIQKEPAFAWWVPYTLKKRDRIISAVRNKVKQQSHKYGIEIPRSVQHAYELDKRNGNNYWRKAIEKEMRNVLVAFDILHDEQNISKQFKELGVHMIFDVKMDMTRKARLVAEGHRTADPVESTYAGVVSRESVRIAFTYAALNGLAVEAADIQNAYLTAPTTEKFYIICGPEFGSENVGKKALVTRALYGMKSAGRDFRNHLRDCMEHMEYTPCMADPDVWMRKAIKADGTEYYELMLLYTDDCLHVSEDPRQGLMQLNKYFKLKPESIGKPTIYLGAKITQVLLPNGVTSWAMSASQYTQEAVRNVEIHLKKKGLSLRKGSNSPLTTYYRPECDTSPELDAYDSSYYASLIGILRWLVELGRIDITCETSMMSSYVAMPREGHPQQLFHIFSYLKSHHNARMVFDPSYPNISKDDFTKRQWKEFYGNASEAIPPNAPVPLGKEFIMRCFVDADFAGDQISRRSRSGFLVLLNMAPVYWFSKKQSTIETSTFGSEFCAMKQCCEYLRGLRYKLRMMGIPVNNPCFIYGDNQSVLWNTSVPESTLKKKSSSVAYHFVREGVSRDEWRTSYIKSNDNPSDILTKPLPAGINRYKKVRMVLYDIYPE